MEDVQKSFRNEAPAERVRLREVVSGGQTGVDRAALDAARDAGLPTGGWCPCGRRAEDGVIPVRYPLQETPEEVYEQRTVWNVRDSDATLVLASGEPIGGTALAVDEARRLGRPCLVVEPDEKNVPTARSWLGREGAAVLNVGGPRESTEPGIYNRAYAFLRRLFESA